MKEEPEDGFLEGITAAIADGKAVDWESLKRDGRLTDREIAALRSMETMRFPQSRGESPYPGSFTKGYEIIEELGRGSFGRVFRAMDVALDREVALKVLEPRLGLTDEARDRFIKEARILASLDHPNIVRIYSIDEEDGRIRLSLERIDGRTLEQILCDDGPLAPEEAARIGIEICRALSALHAKSICHLDLKPANVMRAAGGRIVLLDFGVSRTALESREFEGRQVGTPVVMAPEQLEGRPQIGPAADTYALGVVLYWMLGGDYPFEASTIPELRALVTRGRAVPLSDRCPNVPAAFAAIVGRAMAIRPEERFASAGLLEEALRGFLSSSGAPPAEGRPDLHRRRLVRWLSIAGAAVLLVGIIAFPTYLSEPGPLEMELEMIDGKTGRPLTSQQVLAIDDQLALEISLSHEAYVYLFNEDASGNLRKLFPLPDLELTNPLPNGVRHRIPGKLKGEPKDGAYRISLPSGGFEDFVIIASRKPHDPAEELLRELPGPRRGDSSREIFTPPRSLADALLRGVDEIVPSATISGRAPRLRERLPVLRRSQIAHGRVIARVLSFPSESK